LKLFSNNYRCAESAWNCFRIVFDVLEKLGSVKVEVPEVTQSEMGQKQKLREVLDMVNHLLNLTPSWVDQKWSVDSTFIANVHVLKSFLTV